MGPFLCHRCIDKSFIWTLFVIKWEALIKTKSSSLYLSLTLGRCVIKP